MINVYINNNFKAALYTSNKHKISAVILLLFKKILRVSKRTIIIKI